MENDNAEKLRVENDVLGCADAFKYGNLHVHFYFEELHSTLRFCDTLILREETIRQHY